MGNKCMGSTVKTAGEQKVAGGAAGSLAPVEWTDNILLLSDSYKVSHYMQYPKGTQYVYSYFESRGSDREGWTEVCFFGLQYYLRRYLEGVVVTKEKIAEAEMYYADHFGDGTTPNPAMFYKKGWEHILNKHGGKLPVVIKAVPEGMVIPCKQVLLTITNTDPECFWLPNYLETLLVQVWYPMTVATNSRYQKLSIHNYLEKTGNEGWAIPGGSALKLHDFGFRGVSSVESAAIGGAAHLVNFMGTDTVASMLCAHRYYGAKKAAGISIPASEHSTITSWGEKGEVDAMRNMLEKYPTGVVACVSDSFDIYRACREYWGTELKAQVEARQGLLVIRPDSGDPMEVCAQIIGILCEKFGSTNTKTGHKLLPPCVRVIQGDGVDYETIPKILQSLMDKGFAADNIAFGSGGALLQKVNRDTFKCAFKCCEVTVDGKARDVFKDPATDPGKASKKGRLTLQLASETTGFADADKYKSSKDSGVQGGQGFLHYSPCGKYVTVAENKGDQAKDIMVEVFRDGNMPKIWTFDEIRARADIPNGPFSQPA